MRGSIINIWLDLIRPMIVIPILIAYFAGWHWLWRWQDNDMNSNYGWSIFFTIIAHLVIAGIYFLGVWLTRAPAWVDNCNMPWF